MDSIVYCVVAVIVTFVGLIVVGYNVEDEKLDASVYVPLSMLAALCGVAWPIVIASACLFAIGYIPISLGKLMNIRKKKSDFKKKLKETPIDKIKKKNQHELDF